MSNKFVRKEVRYRHGAVSDPMNSAAHIQKNSVSVGQTYHLESDAQFKRDLEQSLADIVTKRLQEAEDEAIGLVKIAEETAEKNAKQIAEEILGKANAQAKEMIELAQSQVDGIKEAAREEGFKSGFQEGYADATAQVEQETVQLLQGVQIVTEKAYQAEKQVLKNFEKNAVELIGHIARAVVCRELSHSPEELLGLVERAVESLYMSGKIKVVINPQVLQDIRAYSAVTEEALARMNRFEFMVDPTLDLTQLFIIGEEGCFDLSPDTQITRLMTPLAETIILPQPEKDGSQQLDRPIETPDIQASLADEEITEPHADEAPTETGSDSFLTFEESLLADEALSEAAAEPVETNAEKILSATDELIQPDEEADENVAPAPEVKVFEFEDFGSPSDEETP